METNKILNADILDIIFEGKNKLYGAYDLRRSYNKRLGKAMFFTVMLMFFAFIGTVFSNMSVKDLENPFEISEARLVDVKVNDRPIPIPPPPAKVLPPVEVNQRKFTTPIVVKNADVKDDEKIHELNEDEAISNITVESDNKALVIQAPVNEPATGIIEKPKVNEEDIIFLKVEKDAQFTGGQQAWIRYLQRNLNANAPIDNGAPAGMYQVIVKFVVNKDGSISAVVAETKHGYGMEEEAVKIIQDGPKWIPALQNGNNVNAYRRQPITFVVE